MHLPIQVLPQCLGAIQGCLELDDGSEKEDRRTRSADSSSIFFAKDPWTKKTRAKGSKRQQVNLVNEELWMNMERNSGYNFARVS